MSRSAFSLATSRLSCELLGLHLAVAWKGLLWIVGELLHPVAQLRRVNVQVLRRLRIRYASILNQAHRLKLELPRKLPSLHDPPPAPSKHLTRCLRNRVQAIHRNFILNDIEREKTCLSMNQRFALHDTLCRSRQ